MTDIENAALARVKFVKNKYTPELMCKKNVVGVGIGFKQTPDGDTIAIMVNVTQKEPRSKLTEEDIIPHHLDDVPVDVVEIGEIRAF